MAIKNKSYALHLLLILDLLFALPSYCLFLDVLFYGSIISFISGILLLMSFASPYWLQSWGGTESPFENMGLWEFCFHNFRHPDYQYDELFNGCHWIWGNEYRYIREKLLPGITNHIILEIIMQTIDSL